MTQANHDGMASVDLITFLLFVAPRVLVKPGVQAREEASPDGEPGCLRGPGGGHGGQDAKASRRFPAEGEMHASRSLDESRHDG